MELATREGLWLVSTVTNGPGDRFQVKAVTVGRFGEGGRASPRALTSSPSPERIGLAGTLALPGLLPDTGRVSIDGQKARFSRAALVEEYSVSMDGVRQDFMLTERPAGDGPLKVQLAVSGARVEPASYGAQLVLEKSGRKQLHPTLLPRRGCSNKSTRRHRRPFAACTGSPRLTTRKPGLFVALALMIVGQERAFQSAPGVAQEKLIGGAIMNSRFLCIFAPFCGHSINETVVGA